MVAPSPVVQHQEGRAATADGAQGSGPPWQRGQRGRGAARNLSSSSDASPRPSSASLRAHLQLTPEIKSTDAGVPKARVTSAGQPADVAAKKAGRSEGEGPPRSSLINYLSSDYVCVSDLHWFTTEDDLLDAAKQAGVKLGYKDLAFTEHKVNGKSKGIVTIDCRSPELASKLVHWFHHNDFQGKKIRPTYVTGLEQGRGSQHPSRPGSSHGYAAPFATNAHGGINFNRLRPNKAVYGMPNGGNDTYIANRQARYETTDETQYPSIRQHAPPRAHVPLKGQGGIKQYVDLAGQGAFGSEYAHAYGVAATPTPANAGGLGTGYQGYGQKSGLFHKIAIGKLQVQDPVQLVPRHHWNISQAEHGMYGQQPYVSDRDHPEYGHIGRGRPAGQALTLDYAA